MNEVTLKVDFGADLLDWLKKEAARTGQSVNALVVSMMRDEQGKVSILERMNINVPKALADRLRAYAKTIGRPYGWVVCDAVSVYLDSAAGTVGAPDSVDVRKMGKTPQAKRGRKPKTNVEKQ